MSGKKCIFAEKIIIKKGPCIRRAFLQHEPQSLESVSYNSRHTQAMPCLRIAIVYFFITPAKITLFFETIKHFADYFSENGKKRESPMHHAPGDRNLKTNYLK